MSDYWLHRHGALPTGRDDNNTYGSKDIDNKYLHRHGAYDFGNLSGDDEEGGAGYPVYPYDVYDSQGHEGTYDESTGVATINNVQYTVDLEAKTCGVTSTYTVPDDNPVALDWIVVDGERYFVTSICNNAFRGVDTLTTVVMGDTIETIGTYAFYQCTALTGSLNLPSVTSIGTYAFYQCTALTGSLNLPSVTSIGTYAFYQCTSLVSVDMPSVTSIGTYTFYGCTSLVSVDMPSATSIEGHTFYGCTSLVSVDMPSVTSIGDYAFYQCTSLVSVDMPSVTSIGLAVFEYCSSLTDVYIGSMADVDSTIRVAFAVTVTTSETPTSISGARVFNGCSALRNLYFYKAPYANGTGNMQWGSFGSSSVRTNIFILNTGYSGAYCTQFCNIDIGNATSVGNSTRYTGYVDTIYLAKSNPSLGDYAFYNSTTITLPGWSSDHTLYCRCNVQAVRYAGTSLSEGTESLNVSSSNKHSGWDGKTLYDYSTGDVIGELVDGKAVYYD